MDMHPQSTNRINGRRLAAVPAICERKLDMTVLKSAGGFPRRMLVHLSAELVQRVKSFSTLASQSAQIRNFRITRGVRREIKNCYFALTTDAHPVARCGLCWAPGRNAASRSISRQNPAIVSSTICRTDLISWIRPALSPAEPEVFATSPLT